MPLCDMQTLHVTQLPSQRKWEFRHNGWVPKDGGVTLKAEVVNLVPLDANSLERNTVCMAAKSQTRGPRCRLSMMCLSMAIHWRTTEQTSSSSKTKTSGVVHEQAEQHLLLPERLSSSSEVSCSRRQLQDQQAIPMGRCVREHIRHMSQTSRGGSQTRAEGGLDGLDGLECCLRVSTDCNFVRVKSLSRLLCCSAAL
eukprot:1158792-Pelagomonas_calceolata.AAC.7